MSTDAAPPPASPPSDPQRADAPRRHPRALAPANLILTVVLSVFGAIVTLSMATTPFLMMLNDWLDRRHARRDGEQFLDGSRFQPSQHSTAFARARHRSRSRRPLNPPLIFFVTA